MEAEQQVHFENNDAASASGSPADLASPVYETANDNMDDTALTEPSPTAQKSAAKHPSADTDAEEGEGEL